MAVKKKKVARGRVGAAKPKQRQASVAPARRRNIDPGWTWDDRLPLSQGKQIGNLIYVSGQVAYDSNGQLVGEGDMKEQTHQAFRNIRTVLEKAGSGIKDIVKINT